MTYEETMQEAKRKFAEEYPGHECWTTSELAEQFDVLGFGLGFCVVRRKSDGVKGSLDYSKMFGARLYFDFVETNL